MSPLLMAAARPGALPGLGRLQGDIFEPFRQLAVRRGRLTARHQHLSVQLQAGSQEHMPLKDCGREQHGCMLDSHAVQRICVHSTKQSY